jgi:hypothetical protein
MTVDVAAAVADNDEFAYEEEHPESQGASDNDLERGGNHQRDE